MFSSTIIGYVTDLKVLKSREDNSFFLAVSIAVNDPFGGSCRLRFTNSNGLLAAFNKGKLVSQEQLEQLDKLVKQEQLDKLVKLEQLV